MKAPEPPWTAADIEYLTAKWDEGLSAGIISQTINRSRSAICGKIHRLRLAGHSFKRGPDTIVARKAYGNGHGRKRDPKPERTFRIVFRAAKIPEPTPVDLSHAKPWLERQWGQCSTPVGGEGADTISCCAPSGEHRYCPAHRAVMFVKPPKRLDRLAMRSAA